MTQNISQGAFPAMKQALAQFFYKKSKMWPLGWMEACAGGIFF